MKKFLSVLMFALFSISAFGGVVRFSAKHVVKPAAKAVRHPIKSAKTSLKVAKKVVY